MKLEGFGVKSYEKLVQSIENARSVKLPNFIHALGIANVGLSNAKVIAKECNYQWESFVHKTQEELEAIDGIGQVIAESILQYFADDRRREECNRLIEELQIEVPQKQEEQILNGQVFVITGSLTHYENRESMKLAIEALGGKVTGSVTKKTTYLINNDTTSTSSKNKKAKELGIPIVSEDEFLDLFQLS